MALTMVFSQSNTVFSQFYANDGCSKYLLSGTFGTGWRKDTTRMHDGRYLQFTRERVNTRERRKNSRLSLTLRGVFSAGTS